VRPGTRKDDPRAQLALALALRSGRSFENFVPGANAQAVSLIHEVLAGSLPGPVYLEACCRAAGAGGEAAGYLPLRDGELRSDMLAGFGGVATLCIDDVDAVAGRSDWERALFRLYNDAEQTRTRVFITARTAPRRGTWQLEDLKSRLAAGVVWRLRPLDDDARRAALKRRAEERGLRFPDEVASFVLARERRDMHSLFALLDELDRSSLQAKRKLTVPFVRELLDGRET